jgi:hypothetical protein
MQTHVNKNDYSGQNIYVGIDVHLKSWKVTVMMDSLFKFTFSQDPCPQTLYNYLVNNFWPRCIRSPFTTVRLSGILSGGLLHGKTVDPFVHLPDELLTETLPDIHKQRGIKGRLPGVGAVAQKILLVYVFANLCDRFPVVQVEHVLGDHGPDQHTGIKRRPAGRLGGIVPVEEPHQIVPGNLGAQHNPAVGRVEPVVKRGLKTCKGKPGRTGVFAPWCTPFGGLSHNTLHSVALKMRKNPLNSDS